MSQWTLSARTGVTGSHFEVWEDQPTFRGSSNTADTGSTQKSSTARKPIYTEVEPLPNYVTCAQLYMGYVHGSAAATQGERGAEWVDGSRIWRVWQDLKAKILDLSQAWPTAPPIFHIFEAHIHLLVRLSCEGYHLPVDALYDSFTEIDNEFKRAKAFKNESTAYNEAGIAVEWKAIAESMGQLHDQLQELCSMAGLDQLPQGTALRVVNSQLDQDGSWRICGWSRSRKALVQFSESTLLGQSELSL
ncbi:hypothetical protein QFC20_004992 [Naganishia adeliensis]|uniref:Uncharacterized protein n=1 Tax=Naganishia adeliensis TaxID=92952 RepID=A0ACC2VTH4_9TREE|nr:hypothetical protein QFC20_004992 [Naganishia adeliensis]